MTINSPIQTMKIGARNLTIAVLTMFSVATVGFMGTTYAANNGGSTPTNGAPTSKEDCKNNGWKQYGFKNQGKCIQWVNTHGNGYGGGSNNNVSTSLNFDISGDNNVVNIVINYLFG